MNNNSVMASASTYIVRIRCRICNLFIPRTTLKRHIETAHSKHETFRCHLCPCTFETSGGRSHHVRLKHGQVVPKQRSHPFIRTRARKKKMPQRKGNMKQWCEKCGNRVWDVGKHIKLAHSGGRFTCKLCSCVFKKKSGLAQHKKFMHQLKQLKQSPVLQKNQTGELSVKDILKLHREKKKTQWNLKGGERVICEDCGNIVLKDELEQHLLTSHRGGDFPCKSCSCVFESVQSLNAHQTRLHAQGKKPLPTYLTSLQSKTTENVDEDEAEEEVDLLADEVLGDSSSSCSSVESYELPLASPVRPVTPVNSVEAQAYSPQIPLNETYETPFQIEQLEQECCEAEVSMEEESIAMEIDLASCNEKDPLSECDTKEAGEKPKCSIPSPPGVPDKVDFELPDELLSEVVNNLPLPKPVTHPLKTRTVLQTAEKNTLTLAEPETQRAPLTILLTDETNSLTLPKLVTQVDSQTVLQTAGMNNMTPRNPVTALQPRTVLETAGISTLTSPKPVTQVKIYSELQAARMAQENRSTAMQQVTHFQPVLINGKLFHARVAEYLPVTPMKSVSVRRKATPVANLMPVKPMQQKVIIAPCEDVVPKAVTGRSKQGESASSLPSARPLKASLPPTIGSDRPAVVKSVQGDVHASVFSKSRVQPSVDPSPQQLNSAPDPANQQTMTSGSILQQLPRSRRATWRIKSTNITPATVYPRSISASSASNSIITTRATTPPNITGPLETSAFASTKAKSSSFLVPNAMLGLDSELRKLLLSQPSDAYSIPVATIKKTIPNSVSVSVPSVQTAPITSPRGFPTFEAASMTSPRGFPRVQTAPVSASTDFPKAQTAPLASPAVISSAEIAQTTSPRGFRRVQIAPVSAPAVRPETQQLHAVPAAAFTHPESTRSELPLHAGGNPGANAPMPVIPPSLSIPPTILPPIGLTGTPATHPPVSRYVVRPTRPQLCAVAAPKSPNFVPVIQPTNRSNVATTCFPATSERGLNYLRRVVGLKSPQIAAIGFSTDSATPRVALNSLPTSTAQPYQSRPEVSSDHNPTTEIVPPPAQSQEGKWQLCILNAEDLKAFLEGSEGAKK